MTSRLSVLVQAIRHEAAGIWSLELAASSGGELPSFEPGAHVDLFLPGGLVRQYSLCGDPADRIRYKIAVLRVATSRGGSKIIHERARPGDRLDISAPRNNFRLIEGAARYSLIAGGIGITPIVPMVERLVATGAEFELHYCTRDPDVTPFKERLSRVAGDRVHFIHDAGRPEQGFNVEAFLQRASAGTHVYCCGPAGLMAAVRSATEHWPKGSVHFEYFAPDDQSKSPVANGPASEGAEFEIELARTKRRFSIPSGSSIVEVLRANGLDVDTSCEAGTCGTCRTRYLSGTPVHKDYVLDDDERKSEMMICCGRAHGLLVLDL
jgi:ferredoxin-NADP reductase